MGDNQTFSFSGLLLIIVALGVMSLLYFTPAPPISLGIGIVLLTAILLVWNAVMRSNYRAPGTAILSRPPWVLLIAMLWLVAVSLVMVFVPFRQSDAVGWFFLVLFFGLLVYGAYVPTTLLFWVADGEGLTRQVLSFRKTLPWATIDWIYDARKHMTQEAFFLPVVQWSEETLIVEAGARRKITVVLRAPLVGSNARPLLEAIRQRAVNAEVGFDRFPAVTARRTPMPPAATAAPMTQFDVAEVAAIGRTGMLPAGWTRLWLRRSAAVQNAIGLPLVALVLFGGTLYLLFAGVIVVGDLLPKAWLTPTIRLVILGGQTILFALVEGWFFIRGVSWLAALRAPDTYFFLVMPLGFVEVKGEQAKGLSFAQVRSLHLGSGVFGAAIEIKLRSGAKDSLEIGSNYGRARDVYAYLAAGLSAASGQRSRGGLGASMHVDG
jgi:hypothetical protein